MNMIWAIMLLAMGIGGNGDQSANAPNVKDTVATTISSAMIQAQHNN
ncbi:GTP-binding protein, partial [Bacillus cereus]|nr:GTP-binding protein [Bacillus cereus]